MDDTVTLVTSQQLIDIVKDCLDAETEEAHQRAVAFVLMQAHLNVVGYIARRLERAHKE